MLTLLVFLFSFFFLLCVSVHSTSLYIACQSGHVAVVQVLLQQKGGAAKHCVNVARQDGVTPLCIVAQNGHYDLVQLLLRHGAAVNAADTEGTTPLLLAARPR